MPLRKLDDLVIFRDESAYATFPALTRAPNGELLCGFRLAPREAKRHHLHSRSRAVLVRSDDDGARFAGTPEPICPEDELGQQDPQLATLSDGRIVASFFRWQAHPLEERESLAPLVVRERRGALWSNMGLACCFSADHGRTFSGFARVPFPWPRSDDPALAAHGGASRCPVRERPDGRLLLACNGRPGAEAETAAYLMASDDGGASWFHLGTIADGNDRARPPAYAEPHLLPAADGTLLCFLRNNGPHDGGFVAISRSDDGGRTWSEPRATAAWGFPQAGLVLPDGRIVLARGYRREPYGVRAQLLAPHAEDIDEAEELVVRDDGAGGDLGYPSLALRRDGTVLVAYYIHADDGVRHIAGSVLAVD